MAGKAVETLDGGVRRPSRGVTRMKTEPNYDSQSSYFRRQTYFPADQADACPESSYHTPIAVSPASPRDDWVDRPVRCIPQRDTRLHRLPGLHQICFSWRGPRPSPTSRPLPAPTTLARFPCTTSGAVAAPRLPVPSFSVDPVARAVLPLRCNHAKRQEGGCGPVHSPEVVRCPMLAEPIWALLCFPNDCGASS